MMKKLLVLLSALTIAVVAQANVWNIYFAIGYAYSPDDGETPVLDDYSVTWSLIDEATGKPLTALVGDQYVEATVRGNAGDSYIEFDDTANGGGYGLYDNYLFPDQGEFGYLGSTTETAAHNVYQYIYLQGNGGEYFWKGNTVSITPASDGSGAIADLGGNVVIGTADSTDSDVNAYWTKVNTVPEPATMSLLGLGALAMVLRRKVRK